MNASEAFEILGLTADSSAEEIKTSYKELARKTHPDMGGSVEVFEALSEAYQTALADLEDRPCSGCSGSGKVHVQSGFFTTRLTCELCTGSGKKQ